MFKIKYVNNVFYPAVLFITVFCFITNESIGQWGLSKAKTISEGQGQNVNILNPLTNQYEIVFSGLLNGTVDGNPTQFYCHDFQNPLTLPDTNYSDTCLGPDNRILYILQNYYPYKSDYAGELIDSNDEASAIQLAIWYFSFSADINSLNNTVIKDRALSIITDAVSNSGNTTMPVTVEILMDIDPEFFIVKTTDETGSCISVNNIHLSLTQSPGNLSTEIVNTVNGYSEPVQVIGSGIGIISAEGDFIFPQGIRFEDENRVNRSIVLAKPVTGRVKTCYDWGTLPVELSSFTASVNSNDIILNWSTSSEINNSGFYIERSKNSGEWTSEGFVSGNGTNNELNFYTFSDRNLNPGEYTYRLKQTDFNGNFEFFNLNQEVIINAASGFLLNQNYPNPFNPFTIISYQSAYSSNISIKIYDSQGKELKTLVNEMKNAGSYKVQFDGTDYPSGIYYYRIKAGNYEQVKKMMLIR